MQTLTTVRALLMAGAIVVVMTAGALGQALTLAKADVPFDFVVGGKIHKAGTYKFQSTNSWSLLTLSDDEGRLLQFMSGTPIGNPNGPNEPRVVFQKQGSTYTLSQVWMAGGGTGRQLPLPKAESGLVQVSVNLSR